MDTCIDFEVYPCQSWDRNLIATGSSLNIVGCSNPSNSFRSAIELIKFPRYFDAIISSSIEMARYRTTALASLNTVCIKIHYPNDGRPR